MDKRIYAFVREYLEDHEIAPEKETIDFEKFCCYCVFYKYQIDEHFNVDNVHVGDLKNDTGLDGIGIVINQKLIDAESEDDIDRLVESSAEIKVKFIFVQSKAEKEFEREKIGDVFDAIQDFFDSKPARERNRKVQRKSELARYLLDKYNNKIKPEKARCDIYYITTARKQPSEAIISEIGKKKKLLINNCEHRFETMETFQWNCDDIEKAYISYQLENEITVFAEDYTDILNATDNVKKAAIATFKFSEFKKIIINQEGQLNDLIFYDNIRGFLGNTQVNQGINLTLTSDFKDYFVIFNNGITMIAKSFDQDGKKEGKFKIIMTDYQIVNGCQTSHILFNCSNDGINIDNIVIPVKIIQTDNEDIRHHIITATNSQTKVQQELLAALSDFPNKLETFYKNNGIEIEPQVKLFYERRPGQYNGKSQIKKKCIVTVVDQMKSFASMFLDLPDQASDKSFLIKQIPKKIFNKNHHPITYYTSSLAQYQLNRFKLSYVTSKKIKYYILMVLKYLIDNQVPKNIDTNSKKIEDYCQKIIEILADIEKCSEYFSIAEKIILEQTRKFQESDNNKIKADTFNKTTFKSQLKRFLKANDDNYSEFIQVVKNKQPKSSQLSLFAEQNEENNNEIPPLSLSRSELAKRFGVTPDTVSRNKGEKFKKFCQDNDPNEFIWEFNESTRNYDRILNDET